MRAFALSFVGAVFIALLPCVASADDNPQALHKAYVGYTFGDPQVASLTFTQTTTDTHGTVEDVSQIRRVGLAYRDDDQNEKARDSTSDGFTGSRFWYSNQNGFTVPVIGRSARLMLAYDVLFTDAVATLPWQPQPDQNIDGKRYVVERAEHKPGMKIDLYLDPATGAYRRAVIDPGGDLETTIDVLGYTKVGGKRFVAKWKYLESDERFANTAFRLNPILSDSELLPPPQTASWQLDNPQPFPVKLLHDRIAVKATVNGVAGLFLLDTGADGINLSGEFARRAGLKPVGKGEIAGPEVDEKVYTGKAATIDIGGNTLHDATVTFGSQSLDPIVPDGELGYDVFARTFVTLDFKKWTMQIRDPSTVDPATIKGVHVIADFGDGTPAVPMQLQDINVYAWLDTGAPQEALIPDGMLTKYGLRFYNDDGLCGELDTLTLGPIRYTRPPACRSDGLFGRQALVGLEFLKQFAQIDFDYSRAEMIFVPAT